MTEAEWLTCDDFDQLWSNLEPSQLSDRRWRLYACACCRLVPDFMNSPPDVLCMKLAEREADGLVLAEEELYPTDDEWDIRWYRRNAQSVAHRAVTAYRDYVWNAESIFRKSDVEWIKIRPIVDKPLLEIFRDITGNSFLSVNTESNWLTETVVTLATGIYAERAFDRLPILADALEDAGCDNFDLLNHLRGDGPHVKGCWALDLVLGKS